MSRGWPDGLPPEDEVSEGYVPREESMTETVKKKRKYITASQRTEALALLQEGSTFGEVAEKLGVQVGTVRSWHRTDERARREGRHATFVSMPVVADQAVLDHLREREVDYGVGTPAPVRVRYSEPDIEGRSHMWLIDRGCTVLAKVFVRYEDLTAAFARHVLLAILEQVQRIQRLAYTGEQSSCSEVYCYPPPPRREEQ